MRVQIALPSNPTSSAKKQQYGFIPYCCFFLVSARTPAQPEAALFYLLAPNTMETAFFHPV